MATQDRVPVQTELGLLVGRDCIHLNEMRHGQQPSVVTFSGSLNSHLCDGYRGDRDFLPFELVFEHVFALEGFELDRYPRQRRLKSSFDRVPDSDWQKLAPGVRHFVVATYDFIYEIAAKQYVLRVGVE